MNFNQSKYLDAKQNEVWDARVVTRSDIPIYKTLFFYYTYDIVELNLFRL